MKLKRIWIGAFLYLSGFYLLERNINSYHIMHTAMDERIPFLTIFILPYLMWFLYIPVSLLYLYKKDEAVFDRSVNQLFAGMFFSLFICLIFPNGTDLRPNITGDESFLSMLVWTLYQIDTSTNVFPSIHVYNSLVVNKAIKDTDAKKFIKMGSLVMMVLICLSTMFLKQHSVLDVLGSMVLFLAMNLPCEQKESNPKWQMLKRNV